MPLNHIEAGQTLRLRLGLLGGFTFKVVVPKEFLLQGGEMEIRLCPPKAIKVEGVVSIKVVPAESD
jgi:hypothetical protein